MTLTRRYFIRSVGIAVASLVMARCIPSGGKDDSPPGGEDDSPRGRLRHCWLLLDWLAQQAGEISSPEKFEQSEQARDELFAEHRAALDDLVAAGELDAAVAAQIQVAFAEAAFHVWRSNAPINCYAVMPIESVARDDLIQQAELLREAASDLDPAVAEEVQAAIARDIAFFEAAAGPEAGTKLLEQFEAGEIEASPEAIEAARFLVNLLLGETACYIPSGGKDDSPRDRLRHCWLRLDWLAQQAREISSEQVEQARDELFAEHRAALDDLVAAGELDAAMADQIQVAFAEAAFHVWRSNAPISCYEAMPVEYVVRDDLIQQAELLREAASDLDPAVVEEVQAAIARDIAFFEAAAGPEAGYELIEQFEAGEIEASPEAIEAARFLVELLLEE